MALTSFGKNRSSLKLKLVKIIGSDHHHIIIIKNDSLSGSFVWYLTLSLRKRIVLTQLTQTYVENNQVVFSDHYSLF